MKKALLLIITVFLLLGVIAGCSSSNSSDTENSSEIQTVQIIANEWNYSPDHVSIKPGKVKLIVENQGKRMHGFAIDELGIKENIAPGQTFEKVITVEDPQELTYYCTVLCGDMDQHEGMKGTLKVE